MHEVPIDRGTALDLQGKLAQRPIAESLRTLHDIGRLRSPLVVDLDPTSFCDLACPDCISKEVLGSKRFEERRLLELAKEMCTAGVKAVVLIGGGEPLLHRATPALIEALAENGVQVGLVTNGTLLTRLTPDLLQELAWIRVSVDAATSATYDRLRPSRRRLRESIFSKVTGGIAYAAQSGTVVGYSFVAVTSSTDDDTPGNAHEIYQAANVAKKLGSAYFELKALMNPDHSLVVLSDENVDLIRQQVAQASQLQTSTFKVLVNSGMQELLHKSFAPQQKHYRTCHVAHLRTLISPTGAYICSYHRGNPRFKIGDLLEQDFETFWRTADLQVVDPRVDCGFHCARHRSNEYLAQGPSDSTPSRLADGDDYFI